MLLAKVFVVKSLAVTQLSPLLSTHLSCSHSTEMKWSLYPNDSNGKTDNATHAPRGYENVYHSHNDAFWGEQGRLTGKSKNSLEEQGRVMGFGFYWVRGWAGG